MGKANNSQSQATLVKQNGERVSAAVENAVNVVSALNAEIGEELKREMLLALNYTPVETDDATEASFTKAVLTKFGKVYTDTKALIEALTEKAKVYETIASQKVSNHVDEFSEWALNLAPTENENKTSLMLNGVNAEGIKVSLPAKIAIENSVSFLLYSFTGLSNTMFFGETERVGKNGKKKPSKPSIFENDKRSVESTRAIGGNENWGFRATVNYLVNSGEAASKYCRAIELIALTAKMLNNDNVIEAQKHFKVLTGQTKGDNRFSFDPSLIKGLVIARVYGLLNSSARQWIKELKDKLKDNQVALNWETSESLELSKLTSDLKRAEAREENEEAVEHVVESSDPQMTSITWKDKAEKRIRKIGQMFGEDFKRPELTDEEVYRAFDHLSKGEAVTEENFEDNFSNEAINEVLYRVIEVPQEEVATATA